MNFLGQKLYFASNGLCKFKQSLLCGIILVGTASQANAEFYNLNGIGVSMENEVSLRYDDNIYSDDSNEVEDFIARLDAQLNFDWNDDNDNVDLYVSGDVERFKDKNEENREQYRIRGDWRHAFSDRTNTRFKADHRRQVSLRGVDFDNPSNNPDSSSISYINDLELMWNTGYKRFVLDTSVSYYDRNADDVTRSNGGTVSHSINNRSDYEAYLKPGYIFAENTTAYTQADFLRRRYDVNSISSVKDVDGYVWSLGVNYDVPNRLILDAKVGWLNYEYASATLEDTTIPTYAASARWWIIDELETNISIERTLPATSSLTTSAIITDTVEASFDYEYSDTITLYNENRFSIREYRHGAGASNGQDRDDEYFTTTFGLEYNFTDSAKLTTEYEYRNRTSNAAASNLKKNILSLSLVASF